MGMEGRVMVCGCWGWSDTRDAWPGNGPQIRCQLGRGFYRACFGIVNEWCKQENFRFIFLIIGYKLVVYFRTSSSVGAVEAPTRAGRPAPPI